MLVRRLLKQPQTTKASYILGDKFGQIKEIGHSNTERDSGVMIAVDVKWKNQVNHVVNKANRMLGLLKRTFESRYSSLWKDLYVALIKPHLDVCSSKLESTYDWPYRET